VHTFVSQHVNGEAVPNTKGRGCCDCTHFCYTPEFYDLLYFDGFSPAAHSRERDLELDLKTDARTVGRSRTAARVNQSVYLKISSQAKDIVNNNIQQGTHTGAR